MFFLVFLLFNSFSCSNSDEQKLNDNQKTKEILEQNNLLNFNNNSKEKDIFNNIVSDLSSKVVEHDYELDKVDKRITTLEEYEVEEEQKRVRVSAFASAQVNGIVKDKKENDNFSKFIPALTFNNSSEVLGTRISFDLEEFTSNIEFSFNRDLKTKYKLGFAIKDFKLNLFYNESKNFPQSSDMLASFSNKIFVPNIGFISSYNLDKGSYLAHILLSGGAINEKEDSYLATFDNRFYFENSSINKAYIDINFNYFDHLKGSERSIGLLDAKSEALFATDIKFGFKNHIFRRSFLRFNYLSSFSSLETNVDETSSLNTIPILKLSNSDALIMYGELNLNVANLRAGLFEAGSAFTFDKSERKRVFHKTPILYNSTSGMFIELGAFQGNYVNPEIAYYKLYNPESYMFSARSYFRISHFNGLLDFSMLSDSYKIESYANLYGMNYKVLYQLDENFKIKTTGNLLDSDITFLKAHLINFKLHYLLRGDDSGASSSLSYTNYGLSDVSNFFNDSDLFTLGYDLYKEGELTKNSEYKWMLFASFFKHSIIDNLSIQLNVALQSNNEDIDNKLYDKEKVWIADKNEYEEKERDEKFSSKSSISLPFSLELKYLINQHANFNFSLGWLSENIENVEIDNFETYFPKSILRFKQEDNLTFRLKLDINIY